MIVIWDLPALLNRRVGISVCVYNVDHLENTFPPFIDIFNRVNYLVLGIWDLFVVGRALLFDF